MTIKLSFDSYEEMQKFCHKICNENVTTNITLNNNSQELDSVINPALRCTRCLEYHAYGSGCIYASNTSWFNF